MMTFVHAQDVVALADVHGSALQIVWFLLIAVLWAGYLFLEGFDFGVGMLMPILGRNNTERRVLVNTIGPVWDGNEVWLLVAGGATFAAFPEWYATMFSGFYLPLLLILLALIVRGVAFEYRGKIDSAVWSKRWDWAITIASWLPSILWGVAFGNILRGVAIDSNFQFNGTAGFFSLLNPYALIGGATTCLIFLMHGAIFLSLKTDGELKSRAQSLAFTLSVPATIVCAAFALWTVFAYSNNALLSWISLIIAALALVVVILMTARKRSGWAFVFSGVAIVFAVALIFTSLYPFIFPDVARTADDIGNSLTVANGSSSQYTLTVMTWVAVALTPIVLLYQGWTYWVFRKRISTKSIPPVADEVKLASTGS